MCAQRLQASNPGKTVASKGFLLGGGGSSLPPCPSSAPLTHRMAVEPVALSRTRSCTFRRIESLTKKSGLRRACLRSPRRLAVSTCRSLRIADSAPSPSAQPSRRRKVDESRYLLLRTTHRPHSHSCFCPCPPSSSARVRLRDGPANVSLRRDARAPSIGLPPLRSARADAVPAQDGHRYRTPPKASHLVRVGSGHPEPPAGPSNTRMCGRRGIPRSSRTPETGSRRVPTREIGGSARCGHCRRGRGARTRRVDAPLLPALRRVH